MGFLSKPASKVSLRYRKRYVGGGDGDPWAFQSGISHLVGARVEVSVTIPGGRVPGRGGEGPVT